MTWLYLLPVRPDETLLPAHSRGVELVEMFWVTSWEVRLICGGHVPLTVSVDRSMSIPMLDVAEGDASLALAGLDRRPLLLVRVGWSRRLRSWAGTSCAWGPLVAPLIHERWFGGGGGWERSPQTALRE
jgi:hypothetical protein